MRTVYRIGNSAQSGCTTYCRNDIFATQVAQCDDRFGQQPQVTLPRDDELAVVTGYDLP
jgi:hypothetical protein